MSDLHKSLVAGPNKLSAPGRPFLLPEIDETGVGYGDADSILAERHIEQRTTTSLKGDLLDDETLWRRQRDSQHNGFEVIEDYKAMNRTESLRVYFSPPSQPTSPVIFCVHGAGSSAMTFTVLAAQLRTSDDTIGICCYDLRGHGDSLPAMDYSMDALVADTSTVVESLCAKYELAQNPIFFLGHSLGGAILSAYLSRPESTGSTVTVGGLMLLDIVQDTAVKSLGAMPAFIRKRPVSFESLQGAIDWHMDFLLFNKSSAELSVPHLLHERDLKWKTDLGLTQPYWNEWFRSLSLDYLGFKGPKLLILSTHEALDKDLIVGQMQGRYQLVAFNNNHRSGHFIQEDLPGPVSACILDFIKRNNSPEKFMRENLGIIPKWGGAINK